MNIVLSTISRLQKKKKNIIFDKVQYKIYDFSINKRKNEKHYLFKKCNT